MPVQTIIEQHLTRLLEELELPALTAKDRDETRGYKLELTPDLCLFLKEQETGLFLFSQIAPLPPQKREELFILLMKANFLGQGTGGSTIGLDKDEKFLTLSLTIPYDMNYKAFKEIIEDFANFVDYWRSEILRHAEDAEKGLLP
jgi:hypothetical protein